MSEKPNDEKEIHMTTIEADRLELHQAAINSLGKRPADTLMEHLPPVGWGDVARKQDLDELEKRIDLRFAVTKQNLDELEKRIDMRFAATKKNLDELEKRIGLRFVAVDQALANHGKQMSGIVHGMWTMGGIMAAGFFGLTAAIITKL